MKQIESSNKSANQLQEKESAPKEQFQKSWPIWLGFIIPIAIVGLAAAGFYYLELLPQQTASGAAKQSKTVIGKDYYVLVTLVELSKSNLQNESWDEYNNSAPDISVEVFWKGQRVYRSSTKTDSFVAKWSNAEFDLIGMALSGKSTSVDEAIRAARINIRSGDEIEVRVYDEDLLGIKEEAGRKRFATSDLTIGDTTYSYKEEGIKRIILRVLDMDSPPDMFK